MFSFLFLIVFGLIAGTIAKWLHPGDEPIGLLPTIGIGIAGSFIGGMLHLILVGGHFHTAGLVWSIVGGVIFCYAYSYYKKVN